MDTGFYFQGDDNFKPSSIIIETEEDVSMAMSNPHYSWALLLQSPIRCCDEPSAGRLAVRPLNVLHEYALGSHGSARKSHTPSLPHIMGEGGVGDDEAS